jgi:hypothetical protein
MFSVKSVPDESLTLDIHFQDDLTPSNVATLTTELVHYFYITLKIKFRATHYSPRSLPMKGI